MSSELPPEPPPLTDPVVILDMCYAQWYGAMNMNAKRRWWVHMMRGMVDVGWKFEPKWDRGQRDHFLWWGFRYLSAEAGSTTGYRAYSQGALDPSPA